MFFIPFALAAGIISGSGLVSRISVVEEGKRPVQVEIVAIDRKGNELPGVQAFPITFLATSRPRIVSVSYPPETYALCAATTVSRPIEGASGSQAQLRLRSCSSRLQGPSPNKSSVNPLKDPSWILKLRKELGVEVR